MRVGKIDPIIGSKEFLLKKKRAFFKDKSLSSFCKYVENEMQFREDSRALK